MQANLNEILNKPHMQHVAGFPGLKTLLPIELTLLDRFMAFCSDRCLADPCVNDVRAFGELDSVGAREMIGLQGAFSALGLGADFDAMASVVAKEIRHKEDFDGITRGLNRPVDFKVSVPKEGFPDDWKSTLARLWRDELYSVPILKRMEHRLGLFLWSARSAGLGSDFSSEKALGALMLDLKVRSAEQNDGTPRWAYLRTAFEELRRFASVYGCNEEANHMLRLYEKVMARREHLQKPLKMTKILSLPKASELLAEAETMLEKAPKQFKPQFRHALRNRAAAIGIGIGLPARPSDVHLHHVFGKGVFFDENTGCYRFCYRPHKTETHGDELEVSLDPYWNQFFDALILQDQDPSYLWALREKVFVEKRPLYVNYDRSPCGPSWYSSAWRSVVGTGGHIARTMIYDEMAEHGEFGIQYAKLVCHHNSYRVAARYRSEIAIQKSCQLASEAMATSAGDADISDLLI